MTEEYKFTQDWFAWAPEVWTQLTPLLPHGVKRNFLEIGSFEGRSMVWIADNMMNPGDELFCVDTWEGGEEHKVGGSAEQDMSEAEKHFDYNRSLALNGRDIKVVKYKDTSTHALATFTSEEWKPFDFIYIDGSHTAPDVLTDACMAWPLLNKGGIMVFDDYMWGNPRDALHRPKIAIDAFTNIFGETLDIVHVGYQLVVRKK